MITIQYFRDEVDIGICIIFIVYVLCILYSVYLHIYLFIFISSLFISSIDGNVQYLILYSFNSFYKLRFKLLLNSKQLFVLYKQIKTTIHIYQKDESLITINIIVKVGTNKYQSYNCLAKNVVFYSNTRKLTQIRSSLVPPLFILKNTGS